MSQYFHQLSFSDIITRTELTVDKDGDSLEFFKLESSGGMGHTSRVEEVSEAIKAILNKSVTSDTGEEKILEPDGLECEVFVMKDQKGWQKGKVRVKITLEFCPDEVMQYPRDEAPETKSILDDVRQAM